MTVTVIGTIIGAIVLIAGLYYLITEKEDQESRKIYTIISLIGAAAFVIMLALTLKQIL